MIVLKITGFSLGGIALVLYVSPYFFKDQINDGIKEIAKDYVKTEITFKHSDISFFNHFPKQTVIHTKPSIKSSALSVLRLENSPFFFIFSFSLNFFILFSIF